MACHAVQPVELQFERECRRADKPSKCGPPHAWHIDEPHVVVNAMGGVLDRLVRQPQTAHHLLGEIGAKRGMPVEANAAVVLPRGQRFRHIVQKHGIKQGRVAGVQHIQHHHRVREDIAFRVKFRRLLLALHAGDFG